MSDEELIRELQNATDGLMMMSESDYPFEVVRWQDAEEVSPELLRQKAEATSDVPVGEQSVKDFFAPVIREPKNGEDKNMAAERFRALLALLTTMLDDARAYRIGDINIGVYIVGRSRQSHNLIGVSTRIVET